MQIVRPASVLFLTAIALLLGLGAAVIGMEATAFGPWPGLIPLFLVPAIGMRRTFRRWRTARRPFPPAWREWLEDRVPFYRDLDAAGRARFERDIRFFIEEQTFEAVDGLPVTDRERLAVGAGAALLLHGRPDWELPNRRTILFYPDTFDEDYHDTDAAEYDGMVHAQGPLILSVKAVMEGWENPHDGSNVVLHELAHLFDFSTAFADGVPSLMDPDSAVAWQHLVRREMRRVRTGRSLLRRYAATNPAEFFAVAVENFFERPHALAQRHAALSRALCAFFNLDPRHPGAVPVAPAKEKELPSA